MDSDFSWFMTPGVREKVLLNAIDFLLRSF